MPNVLSTPTLSLQPQIKKPKEHRDFGDSDTTRNLIFDNVLSAAKNTEPIKNQLHTLELKNVDYIDPDNFPINEQKKAILEGRTLGRRLRGTWNLIDNATGNVLDSRTTTIARVPYLTHRGTFIHNGNEYTLGNQLRLRAGIYTRIKDNGEVEAHANILPGKGPSHRYFLDPAKGHFFAQISQAKIPLMPLMRSLGATDAQLRDVWGPDLLAANYPHDDPVGLKKMYERFVSGSARQEPTDDVGMRAKLKEAVEGMELDPEVSLRTLGKPYKNLNLDALLGMTKKLLAVSRNEADPDDRDHLANQTVVGPEDLFSERVAKDAGRIRRTLLWKAGLTRNLRHVPTGALTGQLEAAILHSGLGQSLEEINSLDVFDKQTRISRLGEGGIPSIESVPDEARSVQPSHFGFIDPIRTPESFRVGVDVQLTNQTRKGRDGRIYAPFRNVRTNKVEYHSPQDVADLAIAFPGELETGAKRVVAMSGGKLKYVPRDKVDLVMPHFENAFSPLSNLIPMKSAVKGQRVAMGSRMLTQALPLIGAEAPLVQSAMPFQPDRSFEEEYGKHAGAVRAQKDGVVTDVQPDGITVRHTDGTEAVHQLYHNFPYNRKSYVHNTPLVNPGDRISANQLLAKSNQTDDKGTTALGLNLRTAYIPFRGANFEDATVISESAAQRLSSEHMYQHGVEWTEQHRPGKKTFVGIFPSKFPRQILDTIDDDGIVREGTVVDFGHPLILSSRQKEVSQNKIHRKKEAGFEDSTEVWNHHSPGEVTDVVKTKKGVTVLVKSLAPMNVGDKLSGRYGDKGVIAQIVPDHQMPHDAQGKPFELLLNPLGVISRTNPAQIVEAALGKIAAKTGKAYKVPDFGDIKDLTQYAMDELKKHNLSDVEDIVDPETGRKIPGIMTGTRFYMKLHHTAESKGQGRGTGGYTMAGEPAKGGETGSKRISLMDNNALLSHGALEIMRDAGAIRGQRNEDFWLSFMRGLPPPKPKVPMIYDKFVNELKSAGINVVPDRTRLHIMALTDRDVDHLAEGRNVDSGDTVRLDKGMEPVRNGLFDPTLTGGHSGNRWAAIKLHEPLPNPVMEEPIRRLLGLTEKKFLGVLSGKEQLPSGDTGPAGIQKALKNINLTREIAIARAQIQGSHKTSRDQAIRKLGYLVSAQKLGIHPSDWMLSRAPVLPPKFRPIAAMSDTGMPLVSDPNYLYKELIDANNNLKELSGQIEDVSDERLALYNSFKAVVGLGDPSHPKLVEKNVKGVLKHIFGSSPKLGTVQRRLISSTTDLVGRATITPDPKLDMDQVALPEERAWPLYKHFIIRRLHRRGMPLVQAAQMVESRTALARDAMIEEMKERPVIINRAPVLHRFGIMAFYPQLSDSHTMKISPLIVKGFGADFDGDAMQFHVPVDDRARQEAIDRMLPSRNLLSPADFKSPVHSPSQEYVGGLYTATSGKNERRPHVFRSPQDAVAAWLSGEADIRDPLVIMDHK